MEKIAIIGISCLFPDADNPEQFWSNLLAGKDSISLATEEQMSIDPDIFYDRVKGRTGETGKYYCKKGGYIKNFQFDSTGYHISPQILESLDSIYQWSLYVAKQALKDSGYLGNTSVLDNCGVILGNLSSPTRLSYRAIAPLYQKTVESALQQLLNRPDFQLEGLPTNNDVSALNILTAGYPSAIIAQALSLSGINFSLDAACASALYAVRLACQYLVTGKADLMLAGAISCTDPFMTHSTFSLFQAYPEEGFGCPLDRFSPGLMTGEGAGMFALKRYDDAVRDGDKIYATILGAGLSNDGKGKHFLSPNPKGQIAAFERAYQEAGINPQTIDYVECHATGTPVGDPTELNSMETFFSPYQGSPLVGSVKSNIGHLLTAAGMPSMIKVILSMAKGVIPPTIHVSNPIPSANNLIPEDNVVKTPTPWLSKNGIKRGAVSAFGFGGTNSHLVLEKREEAREKGEGRREKGERKKTKSEKLAIVGMDAFFGSCDSLAAFDRSIYEGKQSFIPLPPQRWEGIDRQEQLLKNYGFTDKESLRGAYIKEFDLDYLQFRIPPDPEDQPIPQQLLILKVADRAIKDAQLQPGANVAVIIAMGTELASHKVRAGCDLRHWQVEKGLKKSNIELPEEKIAQLKKIASDSLIKLVQVNQSMSFIGNIMASRIASTWDFSGAAFTISAEENSTFKALEVAQMLLAQKKLDAVVLGAVDLPGGFENVLLRQQIAKVNTGTPTLSFDRHSNGWTIGEGAGAVVLKRLDVAQQNQERIYCVIDAVSLVQQNILKGIGNREQGTVIGEKGEDSVDDSYETTVSLKSLPQLPVAQFVRESCQQAFQLAGVNPRDIGYLEVFGSGIEAEDEAEIRGLLSAYQTENSHLSCAIGSIKANIGHTYAASGMASLIKTALCLYHQYTPSTPQWSGCKQPEIWQNSPFYVPTESNTWFLTSTSTKRVAAINGLGIDRTYAHLILSEKPNQSDRSHQYLQGIPFYLFPLAGNDQRALLEQLNSLAQTIKDSSSLATVASKTYQAFVSQGDTPYALSIVGHTKQEVLQEIQRAYQGIARAFKKPGEWKTPLGSFFTAKPQGKLGEVAFVYPGGFTSYLGMGRDINHLFPKTLDKLTIYSSSQSFKQQLDISSQLIFPRSLEKLSKRQLENLEVELPNNPAMLNSGSVIASGLTEVLQNYFQIKPKAVFGYSLGEVSMMLAQNVWTNDEQTAKEVDSLPLFQNRIAGEKNAVREFWERSQKSKEGRGESLGEDFWQIYVLLTEASRVRECLEDEAKVYLTHINTPSEVVIAGEPQGCLRVIKKLQCNYFPAPFSYALHCEAINSEYPELVNLFTVKTQPNSEINFYSAADGTPINLTSETIADKLARGLCQQMDFPRLINRVYQDGVRIFMEVGAGNTCCRWIKETLKSQDHVAISLNSRGVKDHTAIVKALAQLVSHRVSLDLSSLYVPLEITVTKKKALIKTVTVGGKAIASKILTPENKEKFALSSVSNQEKVLVGAGNLKLGSNIAMNQTHQSPQVRLSQIYALKQSKESQVNYESINYQNGNLFNTSPANNQIQFIKPSTPQQKSANIIFDEAEVLEVAQGKLAKVFGKDYEIIDSYARCARVPMPPYLFISRVTKLEAKRGCLEPCFIETEYDIPHDAWYAVDSQVPGAIALEASHSNIFLVSYLGLDLEGNGQRIYRNLGGTATFYGDLPQVGDTLRCTVKIDSFSRSGDTLLLFFTYECFVGNRKVLTMKSGGGLFSEEDLKKGQGITLTQREKEERAKIKKQHFQPLLICEKSSFNQQDLVNLDEGNLAACFGANYASKISNPSLRLPSLPMRMLDRVVSVEPTGGAWGLGFLVGEKTLNPEHWYFNCHFKNDFCFPGALLGEGCTQLLGFYMVYLGLHTQTTDAISQPIPNLPQAGRYRGQIRPTDKTLTYQIEITEIGLKPQPFAKANGAIVFEGKTISFIKDIGIYLAEKTINTQNR
jgi:PfaB family protein